jgi:hypothetical protein
LHIGKPKTGSTAIQSFLARNAKSLDPAGILYKNFNDGRVDPTWAGLPPAHFSFAYSTISAAIHKIRKSSGKTANNKLLVGFDLCKKQIRRTDEQFQNHENNDIVISCENFWDLWAIGQNFLIKENARNLTDERSFTKICFSLWVELANTLGRQLVIIVYIRRQDDLINSLYIQAIKNGDKVPHNVKVFYDNYKRFNNDYERLRDIEDCVRPLDKLVVRLYDSISKRGGVVHDFLSLLDSRNSLTPLVFDKKKDKYIVNSSWGTKLVTFKRKFDYYDVSDRGKSKKFNIEMFENIAAVMNEPSANFFDTAFRRQILKDFEKQNSLVAERYLDFNSKKIMATFDVKECELSDHEFNVDDAVEVAYYIYKELRNAES